MRNFYIVTNRTRDPDLEVTKKVMKYLDACGCSYTLSLEILEDGAVYKGMGPASMVPPKTECILVLGGDGTMLRAARCLSCLNLPYLGINLGHLGYLTEGDGQDAISIIRQVVAGEYLTEDRMMLKGTVMWPDGRRVTAFALNDVVINRYKSMHSVNLRLKVNGNLLYSCSGDGLLVATPTGSTAYNLSCGGPLVEPTAKVFIITPIAPHSLNNRSIILSAKDVLDIDVMLNDKSDGSTEMNLVSLDSDIVNTIGPGCRIRVVRSDNIARIVRLREQSFIETLCRKMS